MASDFPFIFLMRALKYIYVHMLDYYIDNCGYTVHLLVLAYVLVPSIHMCVTIPS